MPTDREIAEMILRGGGAGSIAAGGLIVRPANIRVKGEAERLDYGLPDATAVEEVPEPVAPEKPVRPMVGGVQSQAWDRGYTGPKD